MIFIQHTQIFPFMIAGVFSWGQCWHSGGFFGGRGIADFRDAKRKVYFHKDISLLTQSPTANFISLWLVKTQTQWILEHQRTMLINILERRRHNLKRRESACGKGMQEGPGKLPSLIQLLFQLATALFYGTFALHFQNCWKAKLGSAGTIIWTQAASNVPLSTLSSLCCGRKLPGQKPHQNYTHTKKNKPTE